MSKKGTLFFVLIWFVSPFLSYSQYLIPLEFNSNNLYEKYLLKQDSSFHSSFKPLVSHSFEYSEIIYPELSKKTKKSFLGKKIFTDNLILIDSGNFKLTFDPLFDFSYGKTNDNAGKTIYNNTRGFLIRGYIGKNFYFTSRFYENQAVFPDYLNPFISNKNIVPGQGRAKAFKTNGWDYAMASGFLSYSPLNWMNVQFGNGKQFIGEGYRSLLLSDAAFNYPFLKFTANVWRIQYTMLYAQLIDMSQTLSVNVGYSKKFMSLHYLSWNATNNWNISLFETVIWQKKDSIYRRGFDVNYLNPVIFFRPVEYSLNSPDNVLVGLNTSYRFLKTNKIYAQLLIDEFYLSHIRKKDGWWANKYAIQVGMKNYDLFYIKNLDLILEYNRTQPFTYSHLSSQQNYGHYNQPMAHPLGANFSEFVSITNYRIKRFYIRNKFIYSLHGENTESNYGGDIFLSYTTRAKEYNNFIGQGLATDLYINDLSLGILINPNTQMSLEIGYQYRQRKNYIENSTTKLFYISFKTSMRNIYYDF
ncbi:MAG: hypothetical protein GXO79_14310 [Chlorobi bacterium]|nr:hypothetical protein [Chlorobiota bacterium]